MSSKIGSPRPIDTGDYFKIETAELYASYGAPRGREIAMRFPFLVKLEIAFSEDFGGNKEYAKSVVLENLREYRISLFMTKDMQKAIDHGEGTTNQEWADVWEGQCRRAASSLLHYLRVGVSMPPVFVKSIEIQFGNQKYYESK